MGQVTSLFAHKVLAVVDDRHDKRAMLKALGIDPDAPIDRRTMIPDSDYYAFLEDIVRLDDESHDLPLRVGATMKTDDYGVFGLAWKSAPDLLASFERAERFGRLLTSETTYSVERADDAVYFHLNRGGDRRLGLRLSNEASMASIKAISDEVSTVEFAPLAVYLKHKGPDDVSAHERHFGCPVYFDTDRDAFRVTAEQLAVPNRVGDRSLARFFDAEMADEVARHGFDEPLDRRVRSEVSRALSQGVPRISYIAARLGLSGRTLQRRLSEQDLSFQALVDQARRELCERLLGDTDYPLAQVAFMAGFSEQSAFNRAFKRWAGQTPRSYRLQVMPRSK